MGGAYRAFPHHAHLTARARKSQLGRQYYICLGHQVGGGLVRPEEAKIAAIKQVSVPTKHPTLQGPDFSKPFTLQTDALECGVGAVLSQYDEDGGDHAIAYFSGNFLPREQCYSVADPEF